MFIWTDRAGRFSPLKLAVFLGCCLPAAWLLARWATVGLGAKPLTYAIHDTGDWAVRFLLMSLAVTPLRFIGNWPRLILVRRMLGLTVLAYVLAHLTLYTAEQAWNLPKVASEIVLRFYLTIGFVALLGLVVLGATSTDGMIARLGSARWNRLHTIVYGLTALALVHFFLQTRIDVSQPVLMTGLFLWLMGWRWLKRRGAAKAGPLFGLALGAAFATAAIEAAWYAARTGVAAGRVLMANIDVSFTIRPALWVAAAGLLMLALYLARARTRPAATPRSPSLALNRQGS